MRKPEKLAVEIAQNEIIISIPRTKQQVVYRKDPVAPMLVATDALRDDIDPARMAFLVQAWREAHATALRIGWLSS
jgi:hypothetical protein